MSRDKRPLPVALFVYNRPRQLERSLECLRAENPDLLYVFSDGPRNGAAEDQVKKVRGMIRAIDWVEVEVVERHTNLGLSQSIQQGLDLVFQQNERAVVIEDDVCVSPGYLDYMRACLDRYVDTPEVAGVTGLRYPFHRSCFEGYDYDVFFAPRFSSWGWGTWRRFWRSVDFDEASTIRKLQSCKPDLDRGGVDLRGMADALIAGSLHGGWDVYCCISILLNNQFFVWPTWNQIENYGFTEGTHAGERMPKWRLAWELSHRRQVAGFRLPEMVRRNPVIMESFLEFFVESMRPDSVPPRWLSALRSVAGRIKRSVS